MAHARKNGWRCQTRKIEGDQREGSGVYDTPLRRSSNIDSSTTKKMLIPNDVSSGNFRRDVSNADRFGTDTGPTVEISSINSGQGGGDIPIIPGEAKGRTKDWQCSNAANGKCGIPRQHVERHPVRRRRSWNRPSTPQRATGSAC